MTWAPIWTLACRKARECARLTGRVRELELDVAILKAKLRRAIDERDRARELVAVMSCEQGFSAEDEAFLRSLGERGAG